MSSRISGDPPRCALSADVVRINRTLLCSRQCEQCLARRDVHTDELLVLLVEYPVILLERTNCFGSSLDAQTCSLTEGSLEGSWMLSSSS